MKAIKSWTIVGIVIFAALVLSSCLFSNMNPNNLPEFTMNLGGDKVTVLVPESFPIPDKTWRSGNVADPRYPGICTTQFGKYENPFFPSCGVVVRYKCSDKTVVAIYWGNPQERHWYIFNKQNQPEEVSVDMYHEVLKTLSNNEL